MVKTGKLFLTYIFFILLIVTFTSWATVMLEVRSVEGMPIRHVAVGCTCDIRAKLQVGDTPTHGQTPEFVLEDKDQQFEVLAAIPSQGIFEFNGVRKNIYTQVWRAKACKAGVAQLKVLVNNEQSTSYSMPVTEPLADTVTLPSCELVLDRTDIVVGETVALVVRLYTDKPCNAKLHATGALPDALKITHFEGPHYSLTRHGSTDIALLEWHGYITAQQEGVYMIPKLFIQYDKPTGFFSLFGYTQPKKLYTAPIQLTIHAVPTGPGEIPVHFIGKLVSFTSNLEKTDLMQGQATTFTLTFEGTGNTDTLVAPQLRLPQELSCYTPHCTREHLKDDYTRITWHYILQTRAPGSIVLPAQEFTWFDTQERICKQLRTDEYTLTVTSAPETATQELLDSADAAVTPEYTQAQEQEHTQNDLSSAITNILAIERVQPALAWQRFYLLLFVPFGFWLFNTGALIITSGRGRRWYYYYTAYWRARRALRQAQKKQQIWLIYAIMRRYIGDRLGLDQIATPTHESLCEYLCSCVHVQFTQEECKQWCLFLQESLYTSVYVPRITDTSSNNKQEHDIYNLFVAAHTWLVKLGRIL